MTSKKLPAYLLKLLLTLCAVILVVVPFHALLTVWAASNFGHYTLFRLWKEVLLGVATLLAASLLLRDRPLSRRFARDWLFRLIGVYALVILLTGFVALAHHTVTKTALADGVLLDLRFLLFLVITWVATRYSPFLYIYWRRLVLWPATAVLALGLLQRFVLPYDFLKHFGYGPQTIYPYETVDHKTAYIRVQSSLRGANPLGAYLVVIVTAAAVILAKAVRQWRYAVFAGAALLVLFLTYSRSAWIGTAASLGLVLFLATQHKKLLQKVSLIALTAVVVILAGATVALRHNDQVQNTFFHTDEHSTSSTSSNTGHVAALKNGLKDIVHQPLGAGAGTAGPASAHNAGKVRIAENYFLQIGQEAGLIGLGLFVTINVLVAGRLWRHRHDRLDTALLASLIGISIVCLFSHAWTDDTLAYLWWGLAGVALAKGETIHEAHQ